MTTDVETLRREVQLLRWWCPATGLTLPLEATPRQRLAAETILGWIGAMR